MPGVGSATYSTVEDILMLARAILNDAEIPGGDVLTDTAPFTLPFAQIAFSNVQRELARCGVETFIKYAWLMAVPAVTNIDPETRVRIDDEGTLIFTPSGANEAAFGTPILPGDLICPLKLWERRSGTTQLCAPMAQPNDGLLPFAQLSSLVDWEWVDDSLQFRGSLQVQDVKMKYERQMAPFGSVNDPVPIRGVDNAVAYQLARAFSESRGAKLSPAFGAQGQLEIFNLKAIAVRRRQRKRSRRSPYSGNRGRESSVL